MDAVEPAPVAVAAFWSSFTSATGVDGEPTDVYAFGDSAKMADDLAALVRQGTKRATAASERELADGGIEVGVGFHSVIVDGSGRPVCVVRTTDVRRGPLSSVDEAFAWDEGEGERTRKSWLEAHRRYFRRTFEHAGWMYDDDLATVFERFEVVWAPDAPDRE